MGKESTTVLNTTKKLQLLIDNIKEIADSHSGNELPFVDYTHKQLDVLRDTFVFYKDLLSQGQEIKPSNLKMLKDNLSELNFDALSVNDTELFKKILEKNLIEYITKAHVKDSTDKKAFEKQFKENLINNIKTSIEIAQIPFSNRNALLESVEGAINSFNFVDYINLVRRVVFPPDNMKYCQINPKNMALKLTSTINQSLPQDKNPPQLVIAHPKSYAAVMAILAAYENPGFIEDIHANPNFRPGEEILKKENLLEQVKQYLSQTEQPHVKEEVESINASKALFMNESAWLSEQKANIATWEVLSRDNISIDELDTIIKALRTLIEKSKDKLIEEDKDKKVSYKKMPDYLLLENKQSQSLEYVAVKSPLCLALDEMITKSTRLLEDLEPLFAKNLQQEFTRDFQTHKELAEKETVTAKNYETQLEEITLSIPSRSADQLKQLSEMLKTIESNNKKVIIIPGIKTILCNRDPAYETNVIKLYKDANSTVAKNNRQIEYCKIKIAQAQLALATKAGMANNVIGEMEEALKLQKKHKQFLEDSLSSISKQIIGFDTKIKETTNEIEQNDKGLKSLQEGIKQTKSNAISKANEISQIYQEIFPIAKKEITDLDAAGKIIKPLSQRIEILKSQHENYDKNKSVDAKLQLESAQQIEEKLKLKDCNFFIKVETDIHAFSPQKGYWVRSKFNDDMHDGFKALLKFLDVKKEDYKTWWDCRNAKVIDENLKNEFSKLVASKVTEFSEQVELNTSMEIYLGYVDQLNTLQKAFDTYIDEIKNYEKSIAAVIKAGANYQEKKVELEKSSQNYKEDRKYLKSEIKIVDNTIASISKIVALTKKIASINSYDTLAERYENYHGAKKELDELRADTNLVSTYPNNIAALEKNLNESLVELRKKLTPIIQYKIQALSEDLTVIKTSLEGENSKLIAQDGALIDSNSLSVLNGILKKYNKEINKLNTLSTSFEGLKTACALFNDEEFINKELAEINKNITETESKAKTLKTTMLTAIKNRLSKINKDSCDYIAQISKPLDKSKAGCQKGKEALESIKLFIEQTIREEYLSKAYLKKIKAKDEDVTGAINLVEQLEQNFEKLTRAVALKAKEVVEVKNLCQQRDQLLDKYKREFTNYWEKRARTYSRKDKVFTRERINRETFITEIIKLLEQCKDGDTTKLLAYVAKERKKYPGRQLQPLLSCLVYDLINFDDDPCPISASNAEQAEKLYQQLNRIEKADTVDKVEENTTPVSDNAVLEEGEELDELNKEKPKADTLDNLQDRQGDLSCKIKKMYESIWILIDEGKRMGGSEGEITQALGDSLIQCLNKFVQDNLPNVQGNEAIDKNKANKFCEKFYNLLHSQDDKIIHHQMTWPRIIGNIGIALVSFGAALGIRFLYSKLKDGYSSSFFSEAPNKGVIRKIGEEISDIEDYVKQFVLE